MITREQSAAQFNALPFETRSVLVPENCYLQIQCLEMEKKRLRQRYRQSVAEINKHIANINEHLRTIHPHKGSQS